METQIAGPRAASEAVRPAGRAAAAAAAAQPERAPVQRSKCVMKARFNLAAECGMIARRPQPGAWINYSSARWLGRPENQRGCSAGTDAGVRRIFIHTHSGHGAGDSRLSALQICRSVSSL